MLLVLPKYPGRTFPAPDFVDAKSQEGADNKDDVPSVAGSTSIAHIPEADTDAVLLHVWPEAETSPDES